MRILNSTNSANNDKKSKENLLKPFRDARPWAVSDTYRQKQHEYLKNSPTSPSKLNFSDLMPSNFDEKLLGQLPKLNPQSPSIKTDKVAKSVIESFMHKIKPSSSTKQLPSPAKASSKSALADLSKILVATQDEYVLFDAEIKDDTAEAITLSKLQIPWTAKDAMHQNDMETQRMFNKRLPSAAPNTFSGTDASRRQVTRTFTQQKDENGTISYESKRLIVKEVPSIDSKRQDRTAQQLSSNNEVESSFLKELENVVALLTDPIPTLSPVGAAMHYNTAFADAQIRFTKSEQTELALQKLRSWMKAPPNQPVNTPRGVCLSLFDMGLVPVLLHCIRAFRDNQSIVAQSCQILLRLESFQRLTSSSILDNGGTSLLLHILSQNTASSLTTWGPPEADSDNLFPSEDTSLGLNSVTPDVFDTATPPSVIERIDKTSSIASDGEQKSLSRTTSFGKNSGLYSAKSTTQSPRRRSLSVANQAMFNNAAASSNMQQYSEPFDASLGDVRGMNASASNLLSLSSTSLDSSIASDLNNSASQNINPFNFTPTTVSPIYHNNVFQMQQQIVTTPGVTPAPSPGRPGTTRFNFRRLSLNHSSSSVFSNTETAVTQPSNETQSFYNEPFQQNDANAGDGNSPHSRQVSSIISPQLLPTNVPPQPIMLSKRRLSWQRGLSVRTNDVTNDLSDRVSSIPSTPLLGKAQLTPSANINLAAINKDTIDTVPRTQLELQFLKMQWVLSKLENLLIMDGRMFFSSDPHGVIESIMKDAKQMVDAEAVFITLVDPATEELIAYESVKRFRPAPDKSSDGSTKQISSEQQLWSDTIAISDRKLAKFPPGHGIVGRVAQTKEGLNIPLVVECPWFNNNIDCRTKSVFAQSIMCIPMIKDNVLHGCLSVINKLKPVIPKMTDGSAEDKDDTSTSAADPNYVPPFPQRRHSISHTMRSSNGSFSNDVLNSAAGTKPNGGSSHKLSAFGSNLVEAFNDEDEGLLNLLADRIVVTMINAKRKDDLGQVQERIDLLLKNAQTMTTALYNTKDLARMVMQAAKELVQADSCVLVIYDVSLKQNIMFMPTRYGLAELRVDDQSGIYNQVIKENSILQIDDVSKDSRYSAELDKKYGYNTQSLLAVPLKSSTTGRAFGCVLVRNKIKEIKFNPEDVKMLSGFCAQAALTFEKLNHVKELDEVHNFMKRVLESIQATVIVVDENAFLLSCNKTWLWESVGLSKEDYMQRPFTFYLKDSPTMVQDLIQCQRNGTVVYQPSFPFEIKTRNGTKRMHLKYSMNPLKPSSSDESSAKDGKSRSVVLVLEDLTAEKRALDTLGRYMDPALVKEVMSEHGNELGGVRRRIAILFSDIRSFTSIAESLEPQQVVKLLNEHFEDSVDAILSEHGILDKFIGDAVMAVFGVPFTSDSDSINACNAALKMLEALKLANKRREANGQKVIRIGIGINTGEVLSGNIGSTKRMEYSCIGDAVNLSSRLESLTKHYHSSLLITEYTKEELDDQFIVREVDKVQVVGKKRGVAIFDIQGKTNNCSPVEYSAKMQLIDLYGQALTRYRRGMFTEAKDLFYKCVTQFNKDGPSVTMYERCVEYERKPPDLEDWKGVFVPDFK